MLYSSDAFSKNGNPTLTRLDGSTWTAQRFGLSAGDIEISDQIYGGLFARLDYVLLESQYTFDSEYEEYAIYVDFYTDRTYTTRANLTEAIDFRYTVFSQATRSYGSPAGSSRVRVYAGLMRVPTAFT